MAGLTIYIIILIFTLISILVCIISSIYEKNIKKELSDKEVYTDKRISKATDVQTWSFLCAVIGILFTFVFGNVGLSTADSYKDKMIDGAKSTGTDVKTYTKTYKRIYDTTK